MTSPREQSEEVAHSHSEVAATANCDDVAEASTGLFARMAILFVTAYRKLISPLFPASCRYRPTCSQYTLTALRRYGFFRGMWLGVKRILRCHPFHSGGHDPVP